MTETAQHFDEDRWRRLWERFAPDRPFLAAEPLEGGISAEVVRIDFRSPTGEPGRALARRHGDVDLARNPRIAYDERALLTLLREEEYPAPGVFGRGVVKAGIFPSPVLITEFIEGSSEPIMPDHAARAGVLLARLHYTPLDRRLKNLPRFEPPRLTFDPAVDSELGGRIIEATNEAGWLLHPSLGKVVLHGDYWPGNLLWHPPGTATNLGWKDTAYGVTVIDWEDAMVGPPHYDLGNARLEWRLAYDARATERFTTEYHRRWSSFDLSPLPWFDLYAAYRLERKLDSFGLEPDEKRQWLAELERFVDEAVTTAAGWRKA